MPAPANFAFGVLNVLGTKLDTITIDVTTMQTHRFPSRITENPVEDGTIYSDHQVLLQTILEIEGRITDAAISIGGLFGGDNRLNKDDAFQELVRLQKNRQPFQVVTGLTLYENMMLEDLSIPRMSRDGRSLRFNAVLKEILIVGKDTPTNRDNIAKDVQHTALRMRNAGLVAKSAFG